MNGFVDECRKEWNRLGVPEAVSNEMAADLAADLAEAEADGASPEEVLGNAVFDAKSFAASWATARGVVPPDSRVGRRTSRARWPLLLSAAASVVVGALGLAVIGSRRSVAVAAAMFHRSLPVPVPPRVVRIAPGAPGQLIFLHSGGPEALGLILLVVGVAGLCLTLWLWRPWSTPHGPPRPDDNMGLPSFL